MDPYNLLGERLHLMFLPQEGEDTAVQEVCAEQVERHPRRIGCRTHVTRDDLPHDGALEVLVQPLVKVLKPVPESPITQRTIICDSERRAQVLAPRIVSLLFANGPEVP